MHVAAAVGTPVVAIYGPTDIRRTRPWGTGHVIVRHDLSCSPCYRLEGEGAIHRCPHHDCLMTITPDEVFRKVVAGFPKPLKERYAWGRSRSPRATVYP